ncbi:MAG TPA: extracellular solute-binding protein [Spirochaetota bacterium]|nr:extracellular solute-binding protein [Spirochaetota bacterium]HOL57833.1 extracellular solute-binding protein [Spirochaetota bacterium]HPP05417.1 extracellular solute-binding protein [Spirochaetota bacterium]
MKKGFFLYVLVVIFSFTLFFGCKVAKSKPVKLHLFHYKQEIVNELNEIALAFSQKYPEISIECETIPNDAQTVLKTRLTSGEAPDIMMLQSYSTVQEYAKAGWLLDITKEPFMERIVDGAKNAVKYNNALYALPMDMAGIGVVYNKQIFKDLGLNIPTTFDELKKVCETINKNGKIPFSLSIKDNWPLGHFYSMIHTGLVGDKLFDWLKDMDEGKGSFKSPADMDYAFMIFDFYKSQGGPQAMSMTYNDQTANFASGKYAMMVQGLWAYGNSKKLNPNLDAGFFPFPFSNDPEKNKLYVDTDSTLAISATSSPEKIEAAKKFFDFLTSPEGVELWVTKCKLIPTVKGSKVDSMDPPFQDLMKYINEGKIMPWAFSMWPTTVFEESKKTMQEYYSKQKTKDEVINYLDSLWKKARGL